MPTSTPTSSFAMAQLMEQANDKQFRNAAQAERLGTRGVLNAKAAQVAAAQKTLDGSVLDATSKFVASGAGAITNAKLAEKGFTAMSPRENLDKANSDYAARKEREKMLSGTKAQALQSTGAATQLISNAEDAVSQSVGGGAMQNQAKIADKAAEVDATSAQAVLDAAKQTREHVQKSSDDANDFLKSANDRIQQTLMNLSNRI